MGRKPIPFDQSPAFEIHESYKAWAEESNTYPNPHAFWRLMYGPSENDDAADDASTMMRRFRKKVKFRLTWSGFNYHWMQLQIKGLVRIEETTGSVQIIELKVVRCDSPSIA